MESARFLAMQDGVYGTVARQRLRIHALEQALCGGDTGEAAADWWRRHAELLDQLAADTPDRRLHEAADRFRRVAAAIEEAKLA